MEARVDRRTRRHVKRIRVGANPEPIDWDREVTVRMLGESAMVPTRFMRRPTFTEEKIRLTLSY